MKAHRGTWRTLRRNELWTERIHDTYKATHKLGDGTRCPDCGAVFQQGRWTWTAAAAAQETCLCPACHRIRDQFPAGYLHLSGEFFASHRDEVVHLLRHREQHEKSEHPLERIMAIEDEDGGMLVTTTDIHLARDLGDALHSAYQGELEYHYNDAENLLRVAWKR